MDVIRLETRCNQRCLFCGADPSHRSDYTLDLRDLGRSFMAASPDERIEISGGEPTLSPLLPRALELARRLGRRISLQTNAMTLADDAFCAFLVSHGLTDAFVSLHAPAPRLSDALTRTPGGFERTLLGIGNLLRRGVAVSVNTVVCRPNARHLEDMADLIHERFGRRVPWTLSFINPYHEAWRHRAMIPRIRAILPFLHAALRRGEALGLALHLPDLCGIPVCFLTGFERHSDKIAALDRGRPFSPHPDKTKGPACAGCAYDAVCDGLWSRYVELYGWDELAPRPRRHGEGEVVKDTALLLGTGCPNRCLFCNEGEGLARRSMTEEEIGRLLDGKPDWIFLSSGEPTTHPDLPGVIRRVRASGVNRVTLVTNGFRLKEEAYLDGLLASGLTEIRISVHGPDAALHDALTQTPGSFDAIAKGLALLSVHPGRPGVQVNAVCVVTRVNLPHLERMASWAFDAGFDKLGLALVDPAGRALDHFAEVVPRLSDAADLLRDLFRDLREAEARGGPRRIVSLDNLPPCLAEPRGLPVGSRSVIETLDRERGREIRHDPTRGKIQGPPCLLCPRRTACEGVYEGYVRVFGWEEFGFERPEAPDAP